MDLFRQIGGVLAVLAILGGTLWWLQQKGVARFRGMRRSGPQRRMESLERLALTPHHSLHLVRVDQRVMLIAVSPSNCSILDAGREAAGAGKSDMGIVE